MSMSRGIWVGLALTVLVCSIPFIYWYSVFNSFEFPKFMVFVGGVFFTSVVFVFHSIHKKKAYTIHYSSLTKCILLYVCIVFIADLFGEDIKVSFIGSMYRHQGFITLISGVLVYLLMTMLPKETVKKTFSFFSLLLFFVTGLICSISLYHGFLAFILHSNTIPLYNNRIIGTFGNPDFLSGYLVMVLPFLILSHNPFKKKLSSFFYVSLQIVLVFLSCFVIVLTGSKSNIFFGGVIIFISLGFCILNTSGTKKILLLVILLVFTLLVGLYYPILYSKNIRFSEWEGRNLFYTAGIGAFLKRPIMGYGQENFELLFPLEKHIKVDSAHNNFLEIAVSSGIFGLLLFCSIFFLAFLQASFPIKLSLLGFLLIGQLNPFSIAHISLFWLLLGFAGWGWGDAKVY